MYFRIHQFLFTLQFEDSIQFFDSTQLDNPSQLNSSRACYVGGAPRGHRRIDLNRRIELKPWIELSRRT